MANALYALGKEKLLSGDIDLTSATVKVALVENDYAQNLTTDEFYDDIAAHVNGTPQTLSGKSVALGVFDAGDVTFPAVAAGPTFEGVVIYIDTGVEATSPLLVYVDTITGFPIAANGGDIVVQWNSGAYKIFSL